MPRANYAMNLDGPNNVRDLGGYPTTDGKQTRWNQFLRSDNPATLSPHDCEMLYRYGVRLQLDLRSDFECKQHPSPLKGYKDIAYHNFQLLDGLNSNEGDMDAPRSLAELYMYLMDTAGAKFADMLRLALQYPDDCVLFNCTAGKDRTGVTAMLLLKAAHCPDDVIIADYAATYANIERDVGKTIQLYQDRGMNVDMQLMRSDPEEMEKTLAHFTRAYGTAEKWLAGIGLTPQETQALQRKLVG